MYRQGGPGYASAAQYNDRRRGFDGTGESRQRTWGEKSALIEKALTVYFDLLDLQVARKRLRDLEKGKTKLLDAEDVWKDLGI